MSERKRVVVVGAGISGLACALRVVDRSKERGENVEVVVLEASDRAGGALGSERVDGFVIERGADGFLSEKPAPIALAKRLGIEGNLVRTSPSTAGAYVLRDGVMHPIPEGFSMMVATRVRPILKSRLLTWRGKARLFGELLIPKAAPQNDESLASFVRRRFGNEVLERLAEPLAGGIYGGDPERLSLRATMPRFLDEEQRSGSVTLGAWKNARKANQAARGARYSLFAAFEGGMQTLIDALVNALPKGTIRYSSAVRQITRTATGATVSFEGGSIDASHVVLAVSSPLQGRLLSAIDPALARSLDAIEHGSCVTVNLGFGSRVLGDRPGYGVVVPSAESRPLMAITFASRKWPDRAPRERDLVRVFLGGAWSSIVTESSDEELIRTARSELRAVLGIEEEPIVTRIVRWKKAMPRYLVGHLDRVAEIEQRAAAMPFLRLAGNSLRGVGIPDAIASGQRAGDSIFQ